MSDSAGQHQPTVPLGTLNDADATRSASDFLKPAADALAFGPGMELGPVRLSAELGRGAMGVVFLARHTLLDRPVAVKFLARQSAGSSDTMPSRFVDEAKAAATVRHPNLTQIYHADVAEGTPYLVLEYVEGPTLAKLLAHAKTLSVDLAIYLMVQISDAVGKLHEHELIHRDLKPSNVLIDREGKALVTDFGLALRRDASDGSAGLAGTPAYMAPEMFEGRVSPRSDIYALGITLFSLLAGKLPFDGTLLEMRQLHETAALPLAALNLPEGVVDILERSCHKQLMFRYKTAHELRRALAALKTDSAKAKRELDAHLLSIRGGVASEEPSAGSTTIAAANAPSTTTYSETIAKAAAAKRDRMRAMAGEIDRQDQRMLNIAGRTPSLPSPGVPGEGSEQAPPIPDVPVATAVSYDYSATPVHGAQRPGLLTVMCIIGMILAPIGFLMMVAGMIEWAAVVRPAMPGWYRAYSFVENALGIVLYVGLLIGVIAAMRLRRWARPVLLGYAVTEIVMQITALMVHLRYTAPAIAREAMAATAPTTQQLMGAQIFQPAFAFCMVSIFLFVSGFAVTLLITLFNKRVKLALSQKAQT